jgi:peptidoglycan/LPS O-acetylase OafA/YrhL
MRAARIARADAGRDAQAPLSEHRRVTKIMDRSGRHRLQHLDMLRGLCALGVVASHVRSLFLVPYGDIVRHGPGDTVSFTLSGLGHECVIAFFALSGFLVGGSTLAALRARRFSWLDYGVARLSRLWTVLVPALLLTALLDFAGAALAPPGTYQGALAHLVPSGPLPAEPADHSPATFIGNLLFLQTIVTPVFGSNRPLWSLAYEAWYYLAFPLLAFGCFAGAHVARVLSMAAGALALAWLPTDVTLLGIPWVAGAVAANLPAQPSVLRTMAASAATVAALGYAHSSHTQIGDIMLGCAIAVWLRDLAVIGPLGGAYRYVATGLSNISYTLYAVHFPLMLMLWFSLFASAQSQPGPAAYLKIAAFMAAALAYATLVWFLFERRTDDVRRWIKQWLAFVQHGHEPRAMTEGRPKAGR